MSYTFTLLWYRNQCILCHKTPLTKWNLCTNVSGAQVHVSHPPVDAFVIVVGVEKLNFLECFHTGEVAGDERMHDQEEVERCRAWWERVRERKRWRENGGGQKRKEEGGEVNQRALPLLMMKLYVQLIALKRNILGLEIQPTDRETKRHGINTPFTLWIFFLCVCCEFVIQKERRWVQRGEVFNKTVSWHQSKSYSPKTALCLFPCSTPSPLGMCLYCSPLELNARGCTFIISSSTRWDMKQDQGEQRSEEIRAHIRLWSPANGKTEETCSRNRSTELPVFWGPTTMNLGSLSQVFSLDQMSLCRLSSHGF